MVRVGATVWCWQEPLPCGNTAAAPRSLKRGCVDETLSDLERNEPLSGELVLKRRIDPAIPRKPLFD